MVNPRDIAGNAEEEELCVNLLKTMTTWYPLSFVQGIV